jgi:hypothetical protein
VRLKRQNAERRTESDAVGGDFADSTLILSAYTQDSDEDEPDVLSADPPVEMHREDALVHRDAPGR